MFYHQLIELFFPAKGFFEKSYQSAIFILKVAEKLHDVANWLGRMG